MSIRTSELQPASAFADAVATEQSRPRLVTVADGCFCVHDPTQYASTYDIPIQCCATRDDILTWLRQLSEKRWVTTQVIEDFANALIRHFNVSG